MSRTYFNFLSQVDEELDDLLFPKSHRNTDVAKLCSRISSRWNDGGDTVLGLLRERLNSVDNKPMLINILAFAKGYAYAQQLGNKQQIDEEDFQIIAIETLNVNTTTTACNRQLAQ